MHREIHISNSYSCFQALTCNVTAYGVRALQEGIQAQRKGGVRTQQEGGRLQARREASSENHPAGTLAGPADLLNGAGLQPGFLF